MKNKKMFTIVTICVIIVISLGVFIFRSFNSNEKENLENVIKDYLVENDRDISLDRVEVKSNINKEKISKGVYLPGINSYNVYLNKGEIDDATIASLINLTLANTDNMDNVGYVKIYVDNVLCDMNSLLQQNVSQYGYTHKNVLPGMEIIKCERKHFKESESEEVNVKFTLKDEDGLPMKNMVYYLDGSDEEMITDASGEINLKLKKDSRYMLYIQKRNSIVVSNWGGEDITYNQMVVTIDTTDIESGDIIWDNEYVVTFDEPSKKVNIDISDIYEGPYENVFVELYYSGDCHKIGFCDKDGNVEWNDYVGEKFILVLTCENITEELFYDVEIVEGEFNIIGISDELPGINE